MCLGTGDTDTSICSNGEKMGVNLMTYKIAELTRIKCSYTLTEKINYSQLINAQKKTAPCFRYPIVGDELVYNSVIGTYIAPFIFDGFRLVQEFTL